MFATHRSNTNARRRIALAVFSLSVIACTQAPETAPGKSASASNQNQAGINQTESKAPLVLPAGFPTVAPVFPNAKLTDTTLIASPKSYALTYSLEKSKGTTKQVIDFYTAELTKQGWKITEVPILNETTGNYIMSAKKDSKGFRVTTYPLPQQNNDVSINLNLSGYPQ
jgi:hypothetical protein